MDEIVNLHYLKVPVCKTDDYVIKFEEHIQGTFVHCDVKQWNKSVKESLLRSWDTVSNTHGGPIYALHDSKDRKHQKFLQLFGFKKYLDYIGSEEIWIWSKNGKSS